MKKNTPTSLTAVPNFLMLLNWRFLSKNTILFLLAITFYSTSVAAQGAGANNNSPVVLELKTFLANPDNQEVEDLIHKLQSSIYFYNGTVKVYGENPSNLFTDIASLSRLNQSDMPKDNIKIVRISIANAADSSAAIDLSVFSNFPNLKYIYFFSNVTVTEQSLTGMILNNDKKYSIFYKVDRGESSQ